MAPCCPVTGAVLSTAVEVMAEMGAAVAAEVGKVEGQRLWLRK